jgi:hypothetical protein
MENKFKYRPEVKSIEDLQNGDRFLVGEDKWEWNGCHFGDNGCASYRGDRDLVQDLIRANVPIEREIPYPEGGAEKWELREGDDEWRLPNPHRFWTGDVWVPGHCLGERSKIGCIYAIPKPQDKAKPAPKEYTVGESAAGYNGCLWLGPDFKPGDLVTVQRVSEQGEPR